MPLLWLSISFFIGLIAASTLAVHWWWWVLAAALSALLVWLEIRRSPTNERYTFWRVYSKVPAAALLVSFFIGCVLFSVAQYKASNNPLARYADGGLYRMEGQVVSMPEPGLNSTTFDIEVRTAARVDEAGNPGDVQAVDGRARVTLWFLDDLTYGSLVTLQGSLRDPAQAVDAGYARYLSVRSIDVLINGTSLKSVKPDRGNFILWAVYRLRSRAFELINRWYPQPEASLLAGILLGIESTIPAEVKGDFRASGLTHLIAISGFNIALIAGFLTTISRRLLPRWPALVFTLLGILFYTLLAGADASVVRAAVMGSVGIIGHYLGRRQASLNTLCLTAAVMGVFQPFVIYDIGFQLSFLATLGLILYAAPMQSAFTGWLTRWMPAERARKIAAPVGEYLLFTLAAQLTTFPVIAYHFQRFSFSSLLANPLALPAQPLLMITGGLSVLIGLVLPWAGKLLSFFAWPLTAYTIKIASVFGSIRGGLLVFEDFSLPLVLFLYLLLAVLTLGWRTLPRFKPALRSSTVIAGLGLGTLAIWRLALGAPDGQLHLTILSLSGRPAVLVQTPAGNTALIDASGVGLPLANSVGVHLPPGAGLDMYLASGRKNPSRESIKLFFERYPPEYLLMDGSLITARWLDEDAYDVDLPQPTALQQGMQVNLDNSVTLEVLQHTNRSTALMIRYGDFQLLLPGGFSIETLTRHPELNLEGVTAIALSAEELPGGIDSWLALDAPVMIWSGSDPPEGLPQGSGWQLLGEGGWLRISTDGRQMWLQGSK